MHNAFHVSGEKKKQLSDTSRILMICLADPPAEIDIELN